MSQPEAHLQQAQAAPAAPPNAADIESLRAAFEAFTQSTQALEEAHRALDRKLAETNRELALTSEYLNAILDSMSDGVIAVDEQGVVTTFSRAAGAILGYEPEEVLHRPFADIFGRGFAGSPGYDVQELRARDGSMVHVHEKDAPLASRDEHRLGMVKVFQDLRELEQLRARVRQKDRLAAIGEMAATVAHEIRNPLGGMRGFAHLARRDTPDDAPTARLLDKILEGAAALDRVVNSLLEYTRPLDVHPKPTLLSDLIESTIGYLGELPGGIEIVRRVETSTMLLADPDLVRQLFMNILNNAIHACEGSGTITVSSETNGDIVNIAFQDNGAGMEQEQSDQVFAPFFTTKEKGSGLGLAVAAKIAEAHNGRITVHSKPGVGSTFTVTLPRHSGREEG